MVSNELNHMLTTLDNISIVPCCWTWWWFRMQQPETKSSFLRIFW